MSLRQSNNSRLTFTPRRRGSRRGDFKLVVGRNVWVIGERTQDQVMALEQQQVTWPVALCIADGLTYWLFQGRFYVEDEGLTDRQVHALLTTRQQRRAQQIERAEQMVAMGAQPRRVVRGQIPEDVKQYVWMRDQGRCRHCGSTVELQFDHVIPVSRGGSSSVENLQILCGACNRRKSASITVR